VRLFRLFAHLNILLLFAPLSAKHTHTLVNTVEHTCIYAHACVHLHTHILGRLSALHLRCLNMKKKRTGILSLLSLTCSPSPPSPFDQTNRVTLFASLSLPLPIFFKQRCQLFSSLFSARLSGFFIFILCLTLFVSRGKNACGVCHYRSATKNNNNHNIKTTTNSPSAATMF